MIMTQLLLWRCLVSFFSFQSTFYSHYSFSSCLSNSNTFEYPNSVQHVEPVLELPASLSCDVNPDALCFQQIGVNGCKDLLKLMPYYSKSIPDYWSIGAKWVSCILGRFKMQYACMYQCVCTYVFVCTEEITPQVEVIQEPRNNGFNR